jgi:hypothetical protein
MPGELGNCYKKCIFQSLNSVEAVKRNLLPLEPHREARGVVHKAF